jgi:glucose-6-phosphate isomerase
MMLLSEQTMSDVVFSYQHALVSEAIITHHCARLADVTKRMHVALSQHYDSEYAFLNVPTDKQMCEKIEMLVARMQCHKPRICIIVGIGGSNLGTWAVLQALRGVFVDTENGACSILFLDTLDPVYMHTTLQRVERELSNGNTIIINFISKSGSTLETLINFSTVCNVLRTYHPETWQKYVVITTDKDSPLWHYAHDYEIETLVVPTHVGGRFSVFSAVGLFPLLLLGIDIHQLCAGARDAVYRTLQESPHAMAMLSAAVLYEYYTHEISIHDTFLFAPQLRQYGEWYKQLCAESLGKENNRGTRVGITPTVSIGSTDLHSLGQLYLGGPSVRITTFIQVQYQGDIEVGNDELFKYTVLSKIDGSFNKIIDAIAQSTQEAYQDIGRPYMVIKLPNLSAYTIGALMQYKMLEIVYLGYLLEVNPFNQPEVELYKKKMHTMIKH